MQAGNTVRIDGATALVTGANRGLGQAFVDELLARGARRVYAGARDPGAVAHADPRVVPVRLDVTDASQVAAAAAACADVSLLVNNAGVMLSTSMLAPGADDALRREFAVDVLGLRAMIAAFAPGLARHGGGGIVNMLSVVSWFTAPANATYGASKHAALVVSDAARIELNHQGTQVTGVFAGFIDTAMAAGIPGPKTPPAQVVARALDGIEQGLDRVLADARAEQVWQAARLDPDGLAAVQQQRWDARGG